MDNGNKEDPKEGAEGPPKEIDPGSGPVRLLPGFSKNVRVQLLLWMEHRIQ